MAGTLSAVSVKVNNKHIKNGTKTDPETCAVALGIKDHFRKMKLDVSDVEVDVNGVRVSFNDVYFESSKKLQEFIDAFDEGKKVKPTTIQLRQR